MRFVIAQKDLMALIHKVQIVIPVRPAIPILSNLLIEAKDSELTFTATDLLVGAKCFLEVKVLEKGATTLPARHFFQLIRELTSSNIEIFTDEREHLGLRSVIQDNSSSCLGTPISGNSVHSLWPQSQRYRELFARRVEIRVVI